MKKDHPRYERTLVLIKPDGVQRNLVGEIIKRYERIGLKIVGLKIVVPTEKHVEEHYTLDPNWRRVTGEKSIKAYTDKGMKHPVSDDPIEVTNLVLKKLKSYITSGPVIALVLEGAHVVEIVRKITGGTEPKGNAPMGTIRGDFSLDSYHMSDSDVRSLRNLVHASGSVSEANMEIPHWFKPEEIIDYRLIQEDILYNVKIEGIFEK
jgi:nucleoside-diphosphate kinase